MPIPPQITASLALTLAAYGEAAVYLPLGGASPADDVDLHAHLDEAPAAADDRGPGSRDLVRRARATLAVADLGAIDPQPGDGLTVASGAHAGRWVVVRVLARDPAAVVVDLRRAATIAAQAATTAARRG